MHPMCTQNPAEATGFFVLDITTIEPIVKILDT